MEFSVCVDLCESSSDSFTFVHGFELGVFVQSYLFKFGCCFLVKKLLVLFIDVYFCFDLLILVIIEIVFGPTVRVIGLTLAIGTGKIFVLFLGKAKSDGAIISASLGLINECFVGLLDFGESVFI